MSGDRKPESRNKKRNKARNPVARNPLLRKGGAHVRAKSGERFASKQKMFKVAREWQGSRDFPHGIILPLLKAAQGCAAAGQRPARAREIPADSGICAGFRGRQ